MTQPPENAMTSKPTQPTKEQMIELKPCPFCNDKMAHIWTPAQGGYSVICGNGCGAEGPVMENEERAAETWNKQRAQGNTSYPDTYALASVDRRHLLALVEQMQKDAERFVYLVDQGDPLLCMAVRGVPVYALDRARMLIDSAVHLNSARVK